MIYVFDTSSLSILFRNYFPKNFPSLWEKIDALCLAGRIVSTREVRYELEEWDHTHAQDWVKKNKEMFPAPLDAEGEIVKDIFANPHLQANVDEKKLRRGGKHADPFVIAKAKDNSATVVTEEKYKPNAVTIPNICELFDIQCINLEEFMEQEKWVF